MKGILLTVFLVVSVLVNCEAKGLRRIRILQDFGNTLPINGNPDNCSAISAAFNQTASTFNNRSDSVQFEHLLNQSNSYSDALSQLQLAILEASDILELLTFQNLILSKVPEGVVAFTAIDNLLANLSARYANYTDQVETIYNNSNIDTLNNLLFPVEEQVSTLFAFNEAVRENRINSTQCSNLSLCIAIYDSYEALKNANLSINVTGLEDGDYYAAVNDFVNKELGPIWTLKDDFFDVMFTDYIYADLSNYNASVYSNNSFRRYQAEQQNANNATEANGTHNAGDNTSAPAQGDSGNAQASGQRRVLQIGGGDSNAQADNNTAQGQNATEANNTQEGNNQTSDNQTASNNQTASQQNQKVFPSGSGRMKGIDVLKSADQELFDEFLDFIISFNDFIENGLPDVVQNFTEIADSSSQLNFPALVIGIPLEQDYVRVNSHYINDIRQCLNTAYDYPYQAQIAIDSAGI